MNKVLKPKIIILHRLLKIAAIMMPFVIILSLCAISSAGIQNVKIRHENFGALNFVFSFLLIVVTGIISFRTLGLREVSYNFEADRVTYRFGFLFTYLVTVYYKDIIEVSLTQGIFQKKFNVGNVSVITNASNGCSYEIYNVENFQEVYDFFNQKIKENMK